MSDTPDTPTADAVPDVPPTEACGPDNDDCPTHGAYPCPDVPPDPPAVGRDDLAAALHRGFAHTKRGSGWGKRVETCHELPSRCVIYELCIKQADALLSSGVLVDAADVRARALEDAADALFYDGDTDQPMPGYDALFARAVSEREGTT